MEWTGQNIREDKPGHVPMGLKPVLERYNLDTERWVRNVESYGGLFYRIVLSPSQPEPGKRACPGCEA